MIGRIITRGRNSGLKCLSTGSLPLFPFPFLAIFSPNREPVYRLCPGPGCKKHLKIKGTRNYYFKTIGYCFRTKLKSPLILRRFLRRFYATWPWGADAFLKHPPLQILSEKFTLSSINPSSGLLV